MYVPVEKGHVNRKCNGVVLNSGIGYHKRVCVWEKIRKEAETCLRVISLATALFGGEAGGDLAALTMKTARLNGQREVRL